MNRKYSYNKDYFKIVDNREKSYILGLMYADGNNFISKERCKISLVLHKNDKYLLEEINKIIGSNRPLQISYNTSILHISGKDYSDQLSELGCTPRKSLTLKFPNIKQVPEEFLPDFIRGYFDGDGCVGLSNDRLRVTIIGTKEFLHTLSLLLIKNNIYSKIYKQKSQNVFSLKIIRKDSVISFKNLIYDNCSIKLERKYEKFFNN